MAYKDEYEVARLQSDPKFLAKIGAQFEGKLGKDYQLAYHLAPPMRSPRPTPRASCRSSASGRGC